MRGLPDWEVATVPGIGGRPFGIAVGAEATPDTDPVAFAYRNGNSDHLATLYRLAAAVLRPGDRVLDLGAHLGGFALAAAAAGCDVVAVEAAPRNAELLLRAVAANDFRTLRVVHAAVGERTGTVEFLSDGPYGRVTDKDADGPTVAVRAVRVDDLLAEVGWDRADFVKLDVEGFELPTVRGMPKLLARRDAPPVFFESNSHTLGLYGLRPADLADEFRRLGFGVYAIGAGWLAAADDAGPREVVEDYLAAMRLPRPLRAWDRTPGLIGRMARWLRPAAG